MKGQRSAGRAGDAPVVRVLEARGRRRRVLIDVLGAPSESGGMRLHAGEVVRGWLDRWGSEDDVIVLGGPWIRTIEDIDRARRVFVWPNDNPVLRMVGQQVVAPLVYVLTRRRFLLATNSVVSPLIPGRSATVVAHDWRHINRPQEFSRTQLLYRRTWRASARRARNVVAVSSKTRDESLHVLGRADTVTIENGRDHAARWTRSTTAPPFAPTGAFLVTFGHHTNKRPELVVGALAHIDPAERPDLVVLGARGALAARVRSLADALEVSDKVVLPGFVRDDDYRWLIGHAAAVVVASSDEGFGLPLAEAASLDVPSVVAQDSGVTTMFESSAVIAEPTEAGFATAILRALAGEARTSVDGNTWMETVEKLRSVTLGDPADADPPSRVAEIR